MKVKTKVNTNIMAKVMQSALTKGQNENQLTVKELLRDITNQLCPHFKKQKNK
ncbi:hypothetical protein J2Z40_000278 [Cytobacillus eiseniae]|uniref:Uncharacterized protein n=1 Tax=Cytobacillus eiseniae TaxID=762947 RepID=A0ABS4RA04_9BACI|nr:hypothetical protein [Cytobacillus eiseniae]MBP2239725.1 hypothetical protein [Cytobacillus eiseniae]